MKTNSFILMITLALSFNFMGCGSSGSGNDENATIGTKQTGKFIDAPVEGLTYIGTTHQGSTEANGDFTYKTSEEVEFILGNLSLGKATADDIVTPYTLNGDSKDAETPETINTARLLQSLDLDRTDNIITIDASLSALDISDFNLSRDAVTDTYIDEVLVKANLITGETYTNVSAVDAVANLQADTP